MVRDEAFVNQLKSHNQDFRKWADMHHQLENRLESFNRLKFLTAQEEVEKKTLQKRKLFAKDHMQLILSRFKAMN